MAPILESPRVRRRLGRLAAVALVLVAVGVAVVLFPSTNGKQTSTFSNEPVQRVVSERQVPVTPARRAQVNALLDAFVSAAVARRDPGAAYDLVTPAFRSGTSRGDWRHGRIPVYPYEPRGRTFHGWTVDVSYRDMMSVELFLQPRKASEGPVAFSVDLRRLRGRWLIDSFYPRASYASAAPEASARTGTESVAAPPPTSQYRGHGGLIWVLIAVFLSLVVGTPLAIFGAQSIKTRRARRRAG